MLDLTTNKLSGPYSKPPGGRAAIRPDGGGFVVADFSPVRDRVAFVDWNGKAQDIAVKREPLKDWQPEKAPRLGRSSLRWEGNILLGDWPTMRIRIDTDKQAARVEEVPQNQERKGPYLDEQYTFPEGGAVVRVFEWKEPEGLGYRYLHHLEVLGPGEKEPRVVFAKAEKFLLLAPAPDNKLLAVRTLGFMEKNPQPNRIIVLNSQGRVLRDFDPERD